MSNQDAKAVLVDTKGTDASEKPAPDRSRKRSPDATCFVVEFQLEYSPKQRKTATARFNCGTILYNACLREALNRANIMRSDPRWLEAQKMPKTVNGVPNKERKELFQGAKKDARFDAYSMSSFGTKRRVGFLRDNVLSQEAQTLATRAFNAVADWVYSGKGKPRYKPVARGIQSIQTKGLTGSMQLQTKTTLDSKENVQTTYSLAWGKNLVAKLKVDLNNPVHQHGLAAAQDGMLCARVGNC